MQLYLFLALICLQVYMLIRASYFIRKKFYLGEKYKKILHTTKPAIKSQLIKAIYWSHNLGRKNFES